MHSPLRAAPLLLALFAHIPLSASASSEEWNPAGERHIELTTNNIGQEPELRISPNHATTLIFNEPLQHNGVAVEPREYFRSVMVDEAAGTLTLIPSDELPPDPPSSLTVRFLGDALPRSATFRLVMHPARGDQQLQVYRRPRTAESLRQEARQEHARAEQCASELEQTRAEPKHLEGLTGLLDAGLMSGTTGIDTLDLTQTAHQRPGETLSIVRLYGYRALGRVALAMNVLNTGTRPWKAEGAELVSAMGSRPKLLHIWPREPFLPEQRQQLVVEAEVTNEQARETFILKVWEANGPRAITLRGVTFP